MTLSRSTLCEERLVKKGGFSPPELRISITISQIIRGYTLKNPVKFISAAVVATVMLAAGCSSSSKSTNISGGGRTVTVGVLTDLTGAAAVTGDTTVDGIKAGIGMAAQKGYKIKYVVADTTSSPTGALTAAKTLVQQDHVFAVIMISELGFGAASYLASQNIPVIGANVDGPEWLTNRNMFSVFGYADYTKINTVYGKVLKGLGVTKLGGIAYSIEPASYDFVKSTAKAAQMEGIQVPYINTNLAFGTTDLTPVAIAMKNAGINGAVTGVAQATSFALVQALELQGVKATVVLPAGYGGDLTGGGPGATKIAQGVYFSVVFEPAEMHTAATERLMNALKTYAGWTGPDPTEHDYFGYLSIDALVQGLQAAGPNPTQAHFIDTMLGIHNYSAQGLAGRHTMSFALQGRGSVSGYDNCSWMTRYSGSTFHLVPGMDPICGTTLNQKV